MMTRHDDTTIRHDDLSHAIHRYALLALLAPLYPGIVNPSLWAREKPNNLMGNHFRA